MTLERPPSVGDRTRERLIIGGRLVIQVGRAQHFCSLRFVAARTIGSVRARLLTTPAFVVRVAMEVERMEQLYLAFYFAPGQTSTCIGDFDISETKGSSVRVISAGAGHWSQIP